MFDLNLKNERVNVSHQTLFFFFPHIHPSNYLFIFALFVSESTSVGQHREAGKVISETGGWLPDSSGNR